VLDLIEGKVNLPYRELGRQNLKNIARPVEVYRVDIHDGGSLAAQVLAKSDLKQEVRYCSAPDGVRLAFAKVGSGPPIMRSAHWMGHLEYDWELPIFRHSLLDLAKSFTLIRYDARGNGLSDWDVDEVSFDAWIRDMETVVDAAGLDRFPLLGYSQGCALSIAYAAKHPDRVSHLILYGGFATGLNKRPNTTPADRERWAAMKTLMKLGGGSDDATFRQMFTSQMMPTATRELPGSGRKNTIVERRTIVLSETSVVGTGFYNFARATENDTPRPSRFTMVVIKRDGRWMIAHHHSSPLSASRQ
jgi:pimeloyl-ACP methyl ester carboxylesterase